MVLFLMHHPKCPGSQADKARPSSSLWGSKECKFNEAPEVKLLCAFLPVREVSAGKVVVKGETIWLKAASVL